MSETGEILNPGLSGASAKPLFEAHHADLANPENQLGEEEAGKHYTNYVSECEDRLG